MNELNEVLMFFIRMMVHTIICQSTGVSFGGELIFIQL